MRVMSLLMLALAVSQATVSIAAATDIAVAGEVYDMPETQHRCVALRSPYVPDVKYTCTVTDFGPVGTLQGAEYFYALYDLRFQIGDVDIPEELQRPPQSNTAIALFERVARSDRLVVRWSDRELESGVSWFEKPEIMDTPAGPILNLPHPVAGTGGMNGDTWLVRVNGTLQPIDNYSWRHALPRYLPADLTSKGGEIDLKSLSAQGSLWHAKDGNCCASGGQIRITFEIKDRVVRIREVSIQRADDSERQ